MSGETCIKHDICRNSFFENEVFILDSIGGIDDLSEKIIDKARQLPEWLPHISRLGYLITLTMHEACMNAVEHGLLGMDKEAKRRQMEEMRERYLEDLDRRWRASGKVVHVSVCVNMQSVVVGVHDDGEGFDTNMSHYSPMNDGDLLAVSGRGLLILKSLGVRLSWNKPGNSVLCSFHHDELALVITDIKMPVMDGFEFIRKVKGGLDTKGTPVIVISGEYGMDIRDAVFKLGADDFVTKSIDKVDFFPRVRRFIG